MIKKNIVSVILIFSFALVVAIRWMGVSGENYRSIINSDGRGYYQYYVSVLGSHSLSSQKSNGTYLVETEGKRVVNKYHVGLSILWSPFVLPVYFYHRIIGNTPIDFYSEGFQKAISLAALFYLFLGLFALKKLLQSFDVEAKITAFSLFAFFFGTNLSYYTIIAPSMSHVYSFALIAVFLYFIRVYSIKLLPQYFVFATIVLGFIILLRPVNLLIIFAIPIIWHPETKVIELLKNQLELVFLSAFLFLMILAIQPIFWYLQTGSFFQWSYAGEGFYFMHPRMWDFVFSFRKGFLIYTPVLAFGILSLLPIYRHNKLRAFFAMGFILLLIYVLSSWWNWYYGDSYGSRALIDYYPVFILLFALGIEYVSKNLRVWVVGLSMLLIALNVFQSYQYYHNIMSHFDMNKEKYFHILFKSGEQYENRLGGNDDIAPYHTTPMSLIYNIDAKNPFHKSYKLSCPQLSDTTIYGKKSACFVVDREPYTCSIIIDPDSLMQYKVLYAELQCSTYSDEELNDVFWTISLMGAKGKLHYYAFRINGIPIERNQWRMDRYRFPIPVPPDSNSLIQIAIWNKGKRSFLLKDVFMKLYGITK